MLSSLGVPNCVHYCNSMSAALATNFGGREGASGHASFVYVCVIGAYTESRELRVCTEHHITRWRVGARWSSGCHQLLPPTINRVFTKKFWMRVVASLGLQYGKEGAKLRCRLSLGWTLGPSDTSLLSFPTFSTLEVMNPWQAFNRRQLDEVR